MASCNKSSSLSSQKEKLLSNDYHSDDSITSSGYDSCVLSVQDYSDSEQESDNDAVFDNENVLVYENTKPIVNSMEYILSMPSLCDVIFVIGKDKAVIRGLKAVMASRNRMFCRMLLREEKLQEENSSKHRNTFSNFKKKSRKATEQNLTIEIENYDFDVFKRLISFLHLGQVTVTSETVIGLMCAAEEFEIPDLERACWDFSFRCISNGNVATIVQSCKTYKHRTAADQLLTKLAEIAVDGPKTTSV